jgi:hypothetical protein
MWWPRAPRQDDWLVVAGALQERQEAVRAGRVDRRQRFVSESVWMTCG